MFKQQCDPLHVHYKPAMFLGSNITKRSESYSYTMLPSVVEIVFRFLKLFLACSASYSIYIYGMTVTAGEIE